MRRLALAATLVALLAAPDAGAQYAPLDRQGPELSPSAADLAGSLRCTGALAGATRDPLLLLAGTTVTSRDNFSWNYERALRERDIPYCVSDEPGELAKNLGDVQLRGEYVVHALREMHRRSGRRVAVYGHSQGGMVARWALRFWPDTRVLVSDVIGAAPSNHGTILAAGICIPGCAPAIWQQSHTSAFTRALNSGAETFAGIDYTTIASRLDEVVVPYTSQALSGPGRIANAVIQQICPADPAEHLVVGTSDAVAFALVMDALAHDGPADPARIDRAVCTQVAHPGVDPVSFAVDLASAGASLAINIAGYTRAAAEPRPACYVAATSTCPATRPTCAPRRVTIRLPRGLRRATVTAAGRRVRVRRAGGRLVATFTVRATARVVVRAGGRVVQRRTLHACAARTRR